MKYTGKYGIVMASEEDNPDEIVHFWPAGTPVIIETEPDSSWGVPLGLRIISARRLDRKEDHPYQAVMVRDLLIFEA